MNENDVKVVERVIDALGTKADKTVAEYTRSIWVASAAWMVLGIILVGGALITNIPNVEELGKLINSQHESTEMFICMWAFKVIAVIFGAVLIVCQVADLCYPRAAAISKLLCEVVPNSGE